MAFNPFDVFRKNSKPLMAALTIFVMIVFVLSSGGGGGTDFFDWVIRQIGGRDSRGPLMGTIEGDEYRQRELQQIRERRAAANTFMGTAAFAADMKMRELIDQDLKANVIKDEAKRRDIEQSLAIALQYIQFADSVPGQLRNEFANQAYFQYQQMLDQAARAGDNPAEARIYRYIARIFYHDSLRMRFGGLYFGQVPNQTDQEALLYAMFLRLAEKMGVRYTPDDVQRLLRSETEVDLGTDTYNKITGQVVANRFRNMNATQIFDALADEFRVATTMKIVRGAEYSGRASVPVGMTPYEFYEYWKDRCAEVTFDVIDVPVEPFLDKVKETPTETELQRYFDKHKAQEPDPERETPGFKEPRKIKLEYVTVDPGKKVYKDAVPVLEALGTVAGGSTASFVGVGPVPGIMEAAAPLLAEPLAAKEALDEARRSVREEKIFPAPKGQFHGFGPQPAVAQLLGQVDLRAPNLPFAGRLGVEAMAAAAANRYPARAPFDFVPRRTSAIAPAPIASLAGYLATPMAGAFAPAYLGAVGFEDVAELVDTRERVRSGVQLMMAGATPYFADYPVVGLTAVLANLPADPTALIAAERNAERRARRPQEIARRDLDSLVAALTDLRKSFLSDEAKKDKDDPRKKKDPPKSDPQKVIEANDKARKLVEEWLKNHPGFARGQSAALADRTRLADDPGVKGILADLKLERGFDQMLQSLFFNPSELTDVEAGKYNPEVLTDFTRSVPDRSKPATVAWKIDDREPKAYDRYQLAPPEVHAQVLKAWKTEKARTLAKQAADELAGKVRDLARKELTDANNPDAFRKSLADLAKASDFPLLESAIRIARLKREVSFDAPRPGGQPSLRYNPPQIRDERIKYPLQASANNRSGMAEQLIELRNQPNGEVLVLPNRPQTDYFVSVKVAKENLDVDTFYRDVFTKTNAGGGHEMFQDPLYRMALQDQAFPAFDKDLMERLKAEMKYTETEELKKNPNFPESE